MNSEKSKCVMCCFVMLLGIAIFTTSCGSNHYSPLDKYVETINQQRTENIKAYVEAKMFIDSVNNSHANHNHK